jgi:hypothetical protein
MGTVISRPIDQLDLKVHAHEVGPPDVRGWRVIGKDLHAGILTAGRTLRGDVITLLEEHVRQGQTRH